MHPGPITYAEWSGWLNRLAEGAEDEVVLAGMEQGQISWAGGVANLFAQRVGELFNARLTQCSERLTRDLRQGADEAMVVRAILNARLGLYLLHRLASLEVFPLMLRAHLSAELAKFAQRAQQSLEDSARQDRSGRLATTLRNNPLTRFDRPVLQSSHTPITGIAAAALPALPPLAGAARRRNILI